MKIKRKQRPIIAILALILIAGAGVVVYLTSQRVTTQTSDERAAASATLKCAKGTKNCILGAVKAEGCTIIGGAADTAKPGDSLQIKATYQGETIGTATANEPTQFPPAIKGTPGNHGFTIDLTDKLPVGVNKVEVVASPATGSSSKETIISGALEATRRSGTNFALVNCGGLAWNAVSSKHLPAKTAAQRSYQFSITVKNTGTTDWRFDEIYGQVSVAVYDRTKNQYVASSGIVVAPNKNHLDADQVIATGQSKTFNFTVETKKAGMYFLTFDLKTTDGNRPLRFTGQSKSEGSFPVTVE